MTIRFDDLAASIKVPTVAVETDLVSGQTGTPAKDKKLLLMGSQLAAGTATAGVPYEIFSETQARELFGAGSIVSVMVEAALRVSKQLPLYAMGLTEPAGVQATEDITLSGTATGGGVLSVWVAGRKFRVNVETGDTATTIGDAIAAEINAATNLPATAANALGVVSITARNKGVEGNTIRIRSEITAAGVTSTDGAAVLSTGTLAPDPTTPLANIAGDRWHHIAFGCDDSTACGVLETDREARSLPTEQKWGDGIVGSTGAAAAANALAAAFDSYRMSVVWHPTSDQPVYEVIAAYAAERARVVERNRTLNYHELAGITPQYDETAWPLESELTSAINNGVTPLRPLRNGTVQVVRSVHSRTTSPAYIDVQPTDISDYIDEDLITQFRNRYKDAALKVSSPPGTPGVLTPDRAKAVLHERMMVWDEDLDYTQGAKSDISAGNTAAEQNADDANRLDVAFPFRPVFGAHVIAILKTFTLPEV